MKNRFNIIYATKIITVLIAFFPFNTFSQCWNEVWADEFNGTTLDNTVWNYDLGNGCPGLCGWGNSEKQVYTNNADNISVSGGYLNITAKYQASVGGAGYDFTSAKIHTRDKYSPRYGRIEARMKLPSGSGIWPAFWMLPQSPTQGWPTSGEIDIMEFRGDYTNRVSGTLHYGNASPQNQWDGTDYTLSSGDFVSSFHVFAVEWAEGEIRWYIDNHLFKTETQTPNSLNPASNNANQWPWNNNFYLILNMAVGGWYTGNPPVNTITGGDPNFSRTMQVDYIRVYEDISGSGFTGTISGKSSVLQNESAVAYSIPSTAGATYSWSVTGGTLAGGQGTNAITVNWATSNGTVSVQKTLACGTSNYELPVTVQPTSCGVILEDFENIRYDDYGFINGVFTEGVNNPASSSQNTSPYCGRYVRNASESFDVLILDNFSLGNADDFEKRIKTFLMDVYSNGSGRQIDIVLESSAQSLPGNYPTGRHSQYRATTSAVNSWETLQFEYIGSPHAALDGNTVDRLVIMFQSGTNTSNTFYFDNLLVSHAPNTSTITGVATACENQSGVVYSVTNTTGSSYSWTVPAGATITSGAMGPNNNSITVTFGSTSGNVSVEETNTTGCSGAEQVKAVSVGCTTTSTVDPSEMRLKLYPNPANDILKIDNINGATSTYVVTDSRGVVVLMGELDDTNALNTTQLIQGLYHIRVTQGEQLYVGSFSKY